MEISKKVFINIPFRWLPDRYLDGFLNHCLNPEIGIDAQALDQYDRADFRRIADQLHGKGLSITMHAPFFDLSAGSLDPAIRAVTQRRFREILPLVSMFKPLTVVCHAGYDWKRYGYVRNEWIDFSLETWTWLAEQLNADDCRLMLENVYEQGPEDIRILFERLASLQVGFCLDIGHQAAFGQSSLDEWLDQLGPYLGQIHLHDNRGRRDDHMALGQGSIDFKAFFDRLRELQSTPPIVTLEPHTETALWPSLAYLESIWPW